MQKSYAISNLLPHRGRMLLISEILSFDAHKSVTRSVVAEQWPLTDSHGANAMVLIEVVAQTAGVHNLWSLEQEKGPHADHRGWIAGIKKSRLFVRNLPLGTVLETSSENTFAYESMREITGVVRIESQVAAEVILQIIAHQV